MDKDERMRVLCYDDECPCPGKELLEPGLTGFLYISQDVVKMRRDSPTAVDIGMKLERMRRPLDARLVLGEGVINPVVLCRVGAGRRGLDLTLAAADAKKWAEYGLIPLRVTPRGSKPLSISIEQWAVLGDGAPGSVSIWLAHGSVSIDRGNLLRVISIINTHSPGRLPAGCERAVEEGRFRMRAVEHLGRRGTTITFSGVSQEPTVNESGSDKSVLRGEQPSHVAELSSAAAMEREREGQASVTGSKRWWEFWR
jgi:hypothetical protein